MDLLKSFLVLIWIITCLCYPLTDLHAICERYVQCQTMATLDERLCLGNSRSMPFWLSPKNKEDYTAWQCHEKLKTYYKKLEQLESEKSEQLLACLLEQATPMNFDKKDECRRDLLTVPKYNYSGDKMSRVPTQCFQGIKRRIAKECGSLKNCCNSFENCAHLENSDIVLRIQQLKNFVKEFGKKCQLGVEKKFNFDTENQNENADHQPTGNINITVRNLEDNIQASEARIPSEKRLLVKIVTADEEIRRLKNAGKTDDAKKLLKELEKIQNSTEKSSETTIEIVSSSTPNPTTDIFTTSALTPTTAVPITSTTAPESSTTATALRNAPSFITASEPLQDQDLPLHHPWHHPNYPKTITTNQPVELNSELKKFSHVKNLYRLVEQFKDKSAEMVPIEHSKEETEKLKQNFVEELLNATSTSVSTSPEPETTASTSSSFPYFSTSVSLIDKEKLYKFFEIWENAVRTKVIKAVEMNPEPEAAAEYDSLLQNLNDLRKAIYNN